MSRRELMETKNLLVIPSTNLLLLKYIDFCFANFARSVYSAFFVISRFPPFVNNTFTNYWWMSIRISPMFEIWWIVLARDFMTFVNCRKTRWCWRNFCAVLVDLYKILITGVDIIKLNIDESQVEVWQYRRKLKRNAAWDWWRFTGTSPSFERSVPALVRL